MPCGGNVRELAVRRLQEPIETEATGVIGPGRDERSGTVSSASFCEGQPHPPRGRRLNDEWQVSDRRYLSEGFMAKLNPSSDWTGSD